MTHSLNLFIQYFKEETSRFILNRLDDSFNNMIGRISSESRFNPPPKYIHRADFSFLVYSFAICEMDQYISQGEGALLCGNVFLYIEHSFVWKFIYQSKILPGKLYILIFICVEIYISN